MDDPITIDFTSLFGQRDSNGKWGLDLTNMVKIRIIVFGFLDFVLCHGGVFVFVNIEGFFRYFSKMECRNCVYNILIIDL